MASSLSLISSSCTYLSKSLWYLRNLSTKNLISLTSFVVILQSIFAMERPALTRVIGFAMVSVLAFPLDCYSISTLAKSIYKSVLFSKEYRFSISSLLISLYSIASRKLKEGR